MKERDFLNYVVEVARRFGWKCWHVPVPMRASRHGGFVPTKQGAGLPDLFLLHDDPPRLILAEVKGDSGEVTVEQREFLQLARGVAEIVRDTGGWDRVESSDLLPRAVGVYVWKPGDEEALEAILRSKVLS